MEPCKVSRERRKKIVSSSALKLDWEKIWITAAGNAARWDVFGIIGQNDTFNTIGLVITPSFKKLQSSLAYIFVYKKSSTIPLSVSTPCRR